MEQWKKCETNKTFVQSHQHIIIIINCVFNYYFFGYPSFLLGISSQKALFLVIYKGMVDQLFASTRSSPKYFHGDQTLSICQ